MIQFRAKSRANLDTLRKLKSNEKKPGISHEVAVQRMQSILSTITEKLELAVCLPLLLEDENMSRLLQPREMRLFRETCRPYPSTWRNLEEGPEELVKGLDGEHLDEYHFTVSEEEDEAAADSKLTFILEVLNGNSEVLVLVKKLLRNVSPSASRIIYNMRLLNNLVAIRMRTTPEEQLEHEKKLRDAVESLKKAEEEINTLQVTLEAERSKFAKFATDISDSIEINKSIIANIERERKEDIERIVHESETQMIKTYKTMLVKQKLIREQIDGMKENLRETKMANSRREKELRAARLKVEREHATFLSKIDAEISESHTLMENLMAESDVLKKEEETLQRALQVQKILYDQLQEENEIAKQKAFDELLKNFIRNRAARIVQRAWRRHYERSCLKKKRKLRRKQTLLSLKAL